MKNIYTFTKMTLAAVVVATISIGSTTAWSAGTHEDGHDAPKIGEPGIADDVTRTIEISLMDNYFEPEEIKVALGETVRFVLTNEGEFVHEFNIGTPPMHAKHQEEMAMMVEHGVLGPDKINRDMMAMDMGDGQMMKHDDPNSKLLEPGETMEIIWTFNKEAALEFACNIPGHYDSGMVGEFEFSTEIEPMS
jgi:uncharacterized cupredoxin-like copper-binding protein